MHMHMHMHMHMCMHMCCMREFECTFERVYYIHYFIYVDLKFGVCRSRVCQSGVRMNFEKALGGRARRGEAEGRPRARALRRPTCEVPECHGKTLRERMSEMCHVSCEL